MSKSIRLFWWSETRIQKKTRENYGDLLGKYLVEKISGKKVEFAWPKRWSYKDRFRPIYVTVGSIIPHVNKKCIVWGSGIIQKDSLVRNANFLAVRGPQTRKLLLHQGYNVPEVYGDPAILLPNYYFPQIEKCYKFGVIPHYNDYEQLKTCFKDRTDVLLIDLMTNDIEATTDEILSCERIISSSLHGIIVSHAYRIPAVWQKFSSNIFGDGIKYQDYFESVQIRPYIPDSKSGKLSMNEMETLFTVHETLPDAEILEDLKRELMAVCPFI